MREAEAIIKVRIKYQYNPRYEEAQEAALKAVQDGDCEIFDVDVEEIVSDEELGQDEMDAAHRESEAI